MTTATATAARSTEDEIAALVHGWTDAVRTGDLDRIMAYYAPDVVAYDAVLALQFKGAGAYREHFAKCLEMCPGEPLMEVHDLAVEAEGDLAVARYISHCGAIDEDGKEESGWMRATVVCRRTGGAWKIVHEHYSAPFDPESGKALMDIAP